jgi:hypothetical protein
MRCATALQTCLAVLLAFFVSPFQHVHSGSEHDHSVMMHAHFYHIAPAHKQHHDGPRLQDADDDDHDAVWSVDSFTLVPTAVPTLFAPAPAAVAFLVRAVPVAWVDVVEERGHDPPQIDRSIPRAPPS